MKKTTVALCVALTLAAPAALGHIHSDKCVDAIQPSSFAVTLNEIKARVAVSSAATTELVVIDLMAFYQPSYAEKMGSQWVHDRIQHLVDNTNTGFVNSGIQAKVRLVNAQAITGIPDDLHYNTSSDGTVYGAGTIASARIQNPYESFPENAIYEEMGADLALYIRDYNEDLQPADALGFGSLGGELSTVFDTGTLESTNPLYAQGEYVLAHELGHNFEAGHLSDDGGYTFLPAAHAYECGGHTTIMGPADPNGNRFYSSPSLSVNGEACGVEGIADNTSVIKEHASIAAARRDAPAALGVASLDTSYSITEGDTEAVITVTRTGDLSESASVQVALYNDTAIEGRDFTASYERVVFSPGSETTTFNVPVAQSPTGKAKLVLRYPYKLDLGVAESVIVFAEEPAKIGVFGFDKTALSVSESVGSIELRVVRADGSDGEHAVRVYTEDRERKAGVDYTALDTVLVFADGELEKTLTIQITDNDVVDASGTFIVKLDGQGAELAEDALVVTLTNNDVAKPVEPDSGASSSGGSAGFVFVLLLTLLSVFRVTGSNANRKSF